MLTFCDWGRICQEMKENLFQSEKISALFGRFFNFHFQICQFGLFSGSKLFSPEIIFCFEKKFFEKLYLERIFLAPKKFQTDRFHFGEKSSPEIWGIFPEFGLPRLFLFVS